MEKKGLLIVVSGPSGAGKGTVLAHTASKYPNLKYSVSVTTRAPRDKEVDGVNYFFKTEEEFQAMKKDGEFLECKSVYGKSYGTPRFYVEKQLGEGYDVVLEIDTEGALEVKNVYPDCVMVFISPAKRSTIEERLRNRSTESEEQIKLRTQSALKELKQAVFYDYIVVNEDAQQGADDIISIIQAEKCKVKNNKKFIDDLILGGK
ncbi:MAG: guanylate kinase [Clostridia bacterium]|jgi:guanylate kinase|nr:guanylate kinase [Clostridia bacterium]MCI8944296.1 guanylate kinase [Clostridia bacterium]MCI9290836.1 guanylate kinase [Clostridia bacterium]MDE6884683.1 guanylate kinase [Clostridia bacterium]